MCAHRSLAAGSRATGSLTTGSLVTDAGEVVLSGVFGGAVDFGGGPVTSKGDLDGFLLKLVP